MAAYSLPITTAISVLLIFGFLIAIPWTIHSYRKYGFFSFWSTFIMFSFIFYGLAAYFLVILPLPEVRNNCALIAEGFTRYQLMPFYFIHEIFQDGSILLNKPNTYINFILHSSFLPALFNMFILFPLGVYLKYFFRNTLKVWFAALVGFLVSLFFEITQLTALYGIYDCPYRTFNVDDLILNTFGAVFGFLTAPLILFFFPSEEKVLDKASAIFSLGIVRPLPQLIAIAVDSAIVYSARFFILLIFKPENHIVKYVFPMAGMLLLQLLVPLIFNGQTPGTKLLHFKLKKTSSDKSMIAALFKRWIALMLPWIALQSIRMAINYFKIDMYSPYYTAYIWIDVAAIFISLIIVFALIVHGLIVIFGKNKNSFYFDMISGIQSRYD